MITAQQVEFTWGAFWLSAGFAGCAAVVAAVIAAVVAWRRSSRQRQTDRDADARARWWEWMNWVWDNRAELDQDATLDALTALEEYVHTRQQARFLRSFIDVVVGAAAPREAARRPGPSGWTGDGLAGAQELVARLDDKVVSLPPGF